MRVYDDRGNMVDSELGEFSRQRETEVINLFERLFDEGMTALEARGLIGYLTSNLEFSAWLVIAKHQERTEIEEQNDSSRPNNGVATTLPD